MITKDSQVKSLKPKEKRYTNAAGDGLFLDVMPTGKKSWTVAYSKNGKRTRTKIGTYPVLSLKDARVLAQDLQRQALLGYSDILMKDLVKEWLSVYSPNWTSKKYEKNVIHRLELVTERIADVKANEVTRSMISDEIGLIVGRGTIETANRCLRLIKTVFDYAVAKEYVETNPCTLVSKMIPARKVVNMASLPISEMPKFWTALNYMDMAYETKQAIALYNYLACRPSELVKARWDTGEFDLDKGVWIIPKHRMKMRLEHMIPLTEKPLQILRDLYDRRIDDEFVFKKKNKPWEHMPTETPLAAVKRAAGNGKMTTHGFRSLLSTNANEAKLADGTRMFHEDIIERHLAHVPHNKGRAAYNRAKYWNDRVRLMEWWAAIVTPWIEPES
tara:strand:- start:51169 stop:52332 length:1164 start_codon:yes stop_codon:yes gene_type:complete